MDSEMNLMIGVKLARQSTDSAVPTGTLLQLNRQTLGSANEHFR